MTQKPETIIDKIEKEEEAAPTGQDGSATPSESRSANMAASDTEQLLAEKQSELAALEDRFLRQAADFQNFRKRSLEDRSLSIDIGRTQVAMPMIEVLDDLRRSLEAADQAGRSEANAYRALREGVKLVFEKFETELARVGIKPMEVVGDSFDEEKHEAMLQQPAPPGTDTGTVLAEIQKGYMIGDRVLRHARVVVAT